MSSVIGDQIWHIRLEKQLQSCHPDDPVRLERTIRELRLDWNLRMSLARFLNRGTIANAPDIFFSEWKLAIVQEWPLPLKLARQGYSTC